VPDHSDGEKDLGPVIAALSLGEAAALRFRPVPSKWNQVSGSGSNGHKNPPNVLEVTLYHGDVLIMDGLISKSSIRYVAWR
jgi:hypothetical protein